MDMDGDHIFETGIILEHGGNWDVAHMTNHGYLFAAENPLHNGVLSTAMVANAPIVDVPVAEAERHGEPETAGPPAADASDNLPQTTSDTPEPTDSSQPASDAEEGSPVENAGPAASDVLPDSNTVPVEAAVGSDAPVGSFWEAAAEVISGQDLTDHVSTSQFDAQPVAVAPETAIDMTSTDHGVEFNHYVDTFADTALTTLESTPSYFDSHQYLHA
jgi:hypothetical protein